MTKTTYNDMDAKLKAKQAFEGNSVTARVKYDEKNGKRYVVYSYNTLMYSENLTTGKVYFDNSFYSMTTRRIQGKLLRCMPKLSDYEVPYRLGKRGGKHYVYTESRKDSNGEWKHNMD